MSKKKHPPNLQYLRRKLEVKEIKKRFSSYIVTQDNRDALVQHAENINWNSLGNFCLAKVREMIEKIKIPETFAGVKSLEWIVELYAQTIFQFLEYELFKAMILHLNGMKEKMYESKKKARLEEAINLSKSHIEYVINILKYQVIVSSLKWVQDSEEMKAEMKKLEKYADLGKKFYGKNNREYEIPLFKAIQKDFNKLKGTKLEKSYRSLAINVARIELGLIHEREQVNFYNRFLEYIKPKK